MVHFYSRRVRRIFPALLVVLVTTYSMGWAVLFDDEFLHLSKHVASGAIFLSNFTLLGEGGYFESEAQAKPLLHLWSLAVEEQFYVLWPLFLYIAWRLNIDRLKFCLAIAILSLSVNFMYSHANVFYWPHARVWELIVGGVLASRYPIVKDFFDRRPRFATVSSILAVGSLFLGFAFLTKEQSFLLVIVATASTLLTIAVGQTAGINRWFLSMPLVVWLGLISYPLYLWHWPLLSFAEILTIDISPWFWRLSAIAVSSLLACLTFRFIETPVRNSNTGVSIAICGVLMAGLFFIALSGTLNGASSRLPSSKSADHDLFWRETNAWKGAHAQSKSCESWLGLKLLEEEVCVANGSLPHVVFIGDSHAMSLYSSVFTGHFAIPALLLSGHSCDFYPTLTYRPTHQKTWGNNCTALAQEAVRVATTLGSVTTVVISQYWNGSGAPYFHDGVAVGTLRDQLILGTGQLINQLIAAGKNVIYVKDVPEFNHEPSECEQRVPIFSTGPAECRIPRKALDQRRAGYDEAVRELAGLYPNLVIYDLTTIFCDDGYCHMKDGDQYLYFDKHHLNISGSARVIGSLLRGPLAAMRPAVPLLGPSSRNH